MFYSRALRCLGINLKNALTVDIVLADDNVLNMQLGSGIEIDLAGDAREAPEVLIL